MLIECCHLSKKASR